MEKLELWMEYLAPNEFAGRPNPIQCEAIGRA